MTNASQNLIKDLKKQKREDKSLLFLDNIKIINDAIKKGLNPKYILVENEELNTFDKSLPVYKVDRKTIEQLSDSKTPQGVVCVAEYIQNVVKKPTNNFLVLDAIQDPGNAGSLIRTACACGFDAVFMLDSVRVTNSKLIRSSVGTIFDINIYEISKADFIEKNKNWNLNLIKADMNGENVFEAKFTSPVGLVVGNEGQGVSKEISQICTTCVKIPMTNKVESLNAAISGSIIMYQIAKDCKLI